MAQKSIFKREGSIITENFNFSESKNYSIPTGLNFVPLQNKQKPWKRDQWPNGSRTRNQFGVLDQLSSVAKVLEDLFDPNESQGPVARTHFWSLVKYEADSQRL